MVRVYLALSAALALAAPAAVTVATTAVSFTNDCSYEIDLYDNNSTEVIVAGGSTSRALASGFSGMFRHGESEQATLAEFAVSGGKSWYAISVVPPGSGSCDSYDACQAATNKTGYNVPISITPDTSAASSNTTVNVECSAVECESESCDGAYLYPEDSSKLRNCPDELPIAVVFCPSGSDGSSSSNVTITATEATTTVTSTATTTDAPATTEPAATEAATTAPVSTTAATTASSDVGAEATSYVAGTVEAETSSSSSAATGSAGSASSTASSSASASSNTSSGSTGSFSDATINYSYSYEGTNAGSATGTYGRVTEMSSCTTEDVTVTDPIGPFSEEVTMVFRGPMEIYNIAVFTASGSGEDWSKVSSYSAADGTQDNMVFMNNMNIDYTGADSSPQGFASADGASTATESTIFGGTLADASDPTVTGGGPGVTTGVEVNIMTGTSCADDDSCLGYYDDYGYHGWDGGMKMFATKVSMPTGSTANLPAIWMLNAQVVRASQYGCNCRGSGSVGGCGELDVAEVIETNTDQDEVSTHYYFYDGEPSPGGDNYGARPSDSTVTYVTILDNSGTGVIKIIEIGEDDFDFSVDTVTADTVSAWLDATVENLLS
jgi:hypothetical protein